MKPPFFRLWVIVLAWSVPAVLYTVREILDERRAGQAVLIWQVAASTALPWYSWVLFTPLVVRAVNDRPLLRPLSAGAVAVHAGLLTFVTLAFLGLRAATRSLLGLPPLGTTFATQMTQWLPFHLVVYAGVAGVAHTLLYAERARQHEIERAVLAGQLAQAQLDALRMQLHPHFLFNALNTIAMLVRDRDADMAVRLIAELGDILRELLRGTASPAIPLRAELDLLRRYLSIEQVRFGDRLTIEWNIEAEVLDAAVPTLILQPVVENAIRHGISPGPSPGWLRIEAARRADTLVLSVSDNGPRELSRPRGFAEEPGDGAGIGLANSQARLEKLFGRDAYVRLGRTAGVTVATVVLPLRTL